MEIDENKLISAVQNGDTTSFGGLYDAYIERIYRFVWYKVQHKETAEDLTSLTFTKALGQIHTFKPGRGSFKGWLYQIARNSVIDHFRIAKDHRDIEDMWDLASDLDTARDAEARMMVEELQEYLHKLSADQRDIIIMRVWEGLTYREIAEALGKSEDACKMAYSRGLKHLKELMPLAAFIFFITHRL